MFAAEPPPDFDVPELLKYDDGIRNAFAISSICSAPPGEGEWDGDAHP
jgi:hypothetical protein